MKKLLLLTFLFLGANMTEAATPTIPDFDKLWNFSKPAETEAQFKNILNTHTQSTQLDYKLQLLTQIARTQGLQRNFVEAHKTLDQVESSLTQNTKTAKIRYQLERGRAFNSAQKKDLALPLFIKAFDLAMTEKQDHFAIDAAHMVAIAEVDAKKQMEWNLKAVKTAENSADEKAKSWLGSLYNNIGWTYHNGGKFKDALDMFQKALAFREKKGEASTIRIAKWCVARTYRSLDKIEEALTIQKALESEFNKLPEKDGYVYEELGELYLAKNIAGDVQKYFALAYAELSKDAGFTANESKRLARMKELGKVK